MGGLGKNKGPYHEQPRPFFVVFTDIFSENQTSADKKAFFGFHRFLVKKMEIALGPSLSKYGLEHIIYDTAMIKKLLVQ